MRLRDFEVQTLREPEKGEELSDFFEWTQIFCGRDRGLVYGPEVSIDSGDTDTQRHLDRLSERSRCEDRATEWWLTQVMRQYQKGIVNKRGGVDRR